MTKEALFEIVDGRKRKSVPCALLSYSAEDGYRIELNESATAENVPALFIPFIERGERIMGDKWARRWVEERICPPGRQNLGEVLAAHGLKEYDELVLLRSSRGKSSQDDFIVREIPATPNESNVFSRKDERRALLGSQIRDRREALGISQFDLARRAHISQPYLSRIETGQVNLTFDLLTDIAEELELDRILLS